MTHKKRRKCWLPEAMLPTSSQDRIFVTLPIFPSNSTTTVVTTSAVSAKKGVHTSFSSRNTCLIHPYKLSTKIWYNWNDTELTNKWPSRQLGYLDVNKMHSHASYTHSRSTLSKPLVRTACLFLITILWSSMQKLRWIKAEHHLSPANRCQD